MSPEELYEMAMHLEALRESEYLHPDEEAFLEDLEMYEQQVGGDLRQEASRRAS